MNAHPKLLWTLILALVGWATGLVASASQAVSKYEGISSMASTRFVTPIGQTAADVVGGIFGVCLVAIIMCLYVGAGTIAGAAIGLVADFVMLLRSASRDSAHQHDTQSADASAATVAARQQAAQKLEMLLNGHTVEQNSSATDVRSITQRN